MTTVRSATLADVPQLMDMGERFLAFSTYGAMLQPSRAGLRRGIESVIERGVIVVGDIEGRIVGALAGVMSTLWMAPEIPVGSELAWWVDDDVRGSPIAVRLVLAFERWAREHGAAFVSMSDIVVGKDSPAAKVLAGMGYVLAERAHCKELI